MAVNGLRVELCDPPVVLAGRRRGDVGELRRVLRPGIFVDVKIVGGDLAQLAAGSIDERNAFHLQPLDADDAGGRLFRGERAGLARGAFYINDGEVFAVRRPGEVLSDAVQLGQRVRSGGAGDLGE